MDGGAASQLREPKVSYRINIGLENDYFGTENSYFWDTNLEN